MKATNRMMRNSGTIKLQLALTSVQKSFPSNRRNRPVTLLVAVGDTAEFTPALSTTLSIYVLLMENDTGRREKAIAISSRRIALDYNERARTNQLSIKKNTS